MEERGRARGWRDPVYILVEIRLLPHSITQASKQRLCTARRGSKRQEQEERKEKNSDRPLDIYTTGKRVKQGRARIVTSRQVCDTSYPLLYLNPNSQTERKGKGGILHRQQRSMIS